MTSICLVNESNVTVELTANVSLLLASCLPADVKECAQVRQVGTGRDRLGRGAQARQIAMIDQNLSA